MSTSDGRPRCATLCRYSLWPASDAHSPGAWPQTFKLTVDEATIFPKGGAQVDTLLLDVCAWFPQVWRC